MFSSYPTEISVAAFRVLELQNGQPVRVPSSRVEYKVLAAAASFALDLLQSKRGYLSLQLTAFDILSSVGDRCPTARKPGRHKKYTELFMENITKTFPYIVINDLRAMNARTTRFRWFMRR